MSLVELSAAPLLEPAAQATTAPDHRSLAVVAAKRVEMIHHHLRRQPLQRQLLSSQTGRASTYRAAYATSEATSPQWSSVNYASCTSDGSMPRSPR